MTSPSGKRSNSPPRGERRAGARPHDGDVMPCPKCQHTTFEFNARWRVPGLEGEHITVPAWLCGEPQCGFFRFARESDDIRNVSAAIRKAAQELRTLARRKLMKSRFVRQRAARAVSKSVGRTHKAK